MSTFFEESLQHQVIADCHRLVTMPSLARSQIKARKKAKEHDSQQPSDGAATKKQKHNSQRKRLPTSDRSTKEQRVIQDIIKEKAASSALKSATDEVGNEDIADGNDNESVHSNASGHSNTSRDDESRANAENEKPSSSDNEKPSSSGAKEAALAANAKAIGPSVVEQENTNQPSSDSELSDDEDNTSASAYNGSIPTQHIPSFITPNVANKFKSVIAYPSTEKKQLKIMSYLCHFRHTIYDRKTIHPDANTKGYRFPLNAILSTKARPELKFIASKFYKEENRRVPNVWLYYFPSTSDLDYPIGQQFFQHVFPSKGEREHIRTIHEHKNTEAFAIALQDSVFKNIKTARQLSSNIISMVSFRMLEDDDDSGAFIYYLGTLHNQTFNKIMPTSPSFEKIKCPVEGFGMGELLLRITQMMLKCVKQSSNLFLAINRTSIYIRFYNRLDFTIEDDTEKACDSRNSEILQCIQMEASDLEIFKFLSKTTELKELPLNGLRLINRHCSNLERCHEKFTNFPGDNYLALMRKVLENYADEPYKADIYDDRECSIETSTMLAKYPLPKDVRYVSNGQYWKRYHSMWSEDNMISFWNVRDRYNRELKRSKSVRSDRRIGKVMPLEELLMDYSCIGRVISDNDCKQNKSFNIICGFCEQPMTKNPFSKHQAQYYTTMIPHGHFANHKHQVLSFASPEMFDMFTQAVEVNRIEIEPCTGINEQAFYDKIFKASLQDYLIPKKDRESVMVRTHNLYSSFYDAYGSTFPKFFERALRGSADSLMVFHDSKDIEYPEELRKFLEKHQTKRLKYIDTEQKIVDKVIGPHRPKSWTEPQKPLKRRRQSDGSTGNSKRKEDQFSETEIKGNWVTLMKYHPDTWRPHLDKPHCVNNVILEDRDFHYIGRSDVEDEKVYFLVSDDMIPPGKEKQPLFNMSWLNQMEYNEEYEIEDTAKNRLLKMVRYLNGFAIEEIELVSVTNGKRKFRGKQENGHWDENLDQSWINFNFRTRFSSYYKQIMDIANIGKSFKIPSGAIEKDDSDSDDDDNIPQEFQGSETVQYEFENKSACAFGNMANALGFFGDDKASEFFYNHREHDLEEMRNLHIKSGKEGTFNGFHLAREIVRQKFRYQVRFLKNHNLMEIVEKYPNDVLYVQLHPVSTAFTHVICILDKEIVDGTFSKTIKCNNRSIQWLIKDEHYNFIAYRIELTSKVRRILKNPTS